MDLKEEVRRRIAEMTRFAYERGYRDGTQTALAEIESISAEGLVEQLEKTPKPLPVLAEAAAEEKRRPAKPRKRQTQQRAAKQNGGAPKAVTVQQCIQRLLAEKGAALRSEILAAARTANPAITSQDVSNGIRTLAKNAVVRVDPEESTRLLPGQGAG